MPFATVERTHKRFRSNDPSDHAYPLCFTPPFPEDEFGFDFQQQPHLEHGQQHHYPYQRQNPHHNHQQQQQQSTFSWNNYYQQQPWGISHNNAKSEAFSPMYPSNNTFLQSPRRYPGSKKHTGLAIDTNNYTLDTIPSLITSSPPTPLETSGSSVDSEPSGLVSPPTTIPWTAAQTASAPVITDDEMTTADEEESTTAPLMTAATTPKGAVALHDIFSKFNISYTDLGINMEARISSVSDFRVLIDAFSKMCCTPQGSDKDQADERKGSATGIVLYRNPNSRIKPVNFFASACGLGQILHPHSKHGPMTTLQQIVDACIKTFFTCWVRYFPILSREEFMAWYNNHPSPTDTLIVNALCSHCFRHMVFHHGGPQFDHFRQDPYQLQEQEEFFFNRARDCLGQSFDCPDRYAVLSMIYMSIRAETSRRHHYMGMAVSMLHELEIYPRMAYNADDENFEKEIDTRLWWFAWSIDLYLYSAGAPKNTPQIRGHGGVDIPRVFEQDIDDGEISVLCYHHCIQFWRVQADIIHMLWDREAEMTVEQLNAYDQKIVSMYEALPSYLKFDSGFEYGSEELFLACIRVNIECNSSRIILHKPFIPDVNDRYPGRFSLESLNICLSRALILLRALNTCVKVPFCHCAFDRDEMWRVAEVISNAMDIYRACASPLILNGIDKEEYDNSLQKCLGIITQTHEHQARNKDWVQVADWIEVEIRRHQLYALPANKNDSTAQQQQLYQRQNNKPDYFLANLKPSIALNKDQSSSPSSSAISPSSSISSSSLAPSPPAPQPTTPVPVPHSSRRSDQDSSHHEITPSGSMLSVLSFAPSSSPSSSTTSSSSSSITSSFMPSASPTSTTAAADAQLQQQSFVQCNMYAPPPSTTSLNSSSTQSKNQTRFRYFNPRKMNKFLFIDENPIA
ncbi:hypothetical protein BDB00DRAFT_927758 [Zychaea mexicana]|uniref:uncharacterized protein n=1 Tax=Zychaea mexicana TaxID=64656 RepID=UPI0022FE8D3E|nr:uncharacterized protein BDB00DRAFT_927758 [Zychaea mexicana]KAI9495067.1 hypothetical protein BDB00DRAFT_927758 [Zychaea mexicana]